MLAHYPLFFVALVALLAMPYASASVFDEVANATADAIGGTSEEAGYLLGIFLIVILAIIISLLLKDAKLSVLMALSGAGFNALIGWWPLWTLILILIGLAAVLVGIPGVTKSDD